MLISCPSCSTRYNVNPDAVGEAGRRVRCAQCGHTWIAKTPSVADPLAGEDDPAAFGRRDNLLDIDQIDFGETEESEPQQRFRLPLSTGGTGSRQIPLGFLIFAGVLLLIGAVLWLASGPITRALPQTASLYEALGLIERKAGEGLKLSNYRTTSRKDGGVTIFDISGEIQNITQEAIDVPRMRAALLDGNKVELTVWEFTANAPILLPGDSTTFTTSIRNPDTRARDVEITFVR